MQTWAKRGVRAALVTGGVLAVGTTMAAADGAGPARASGDRPPDGGHWRPGAAQDRSARTPERGDSALPALDDARHGPRMAGEVFKTHLRPGVADAGRYRALVLTGRIDPVRDMLPAVEQETTQEMPALREQGWHSRRHVPSMQLAGWVADPATARPAPSSGRHSLQPANPARHGRRTPAEGYHRSLSWAGVLGDLAPDDRGQPSAAESRKPAEELITSGRDLTKADADSIVSLWEGALGRDSERAGTGTGLLDTSDVDLTSGQLRGPRTEVLAVPRSLLERALAEAPHIPSPRPEAVPLQVPGEHQEQANEPPALNGPLASAGEPRSADPPDPGVRVPLPMGGRLSALGGDQSAGSAPNRILEALGQALPRGRELPTIPFPAVPSFRSDPLNVPVKVQPTSGSEAVPERERVAVSPLRAEREKRPPALPLLGTPLPSWTAVQDRTIPGPGLGGHRSVEDTVELQRV